MSSQTPENAYPASRPDRIFWVQQRANTILLEAARVGVEQAMADAMKATGDKAQASNAAYEASRSRTRTLGLVAREDARDMDAVARAVIAAVRGKAGASPDAAEIYNVAAVAPRQAATPQGPPAAPKSVAATLLGDGSVAVKWTGSGTGCTYEVQRKLTPSDGSDAAWSALPGPSPARRPTPACPRARRR